MAAANPTPLPQSGVPPAAPAVGQAGPAPMAGAPSPKKGIFASTLKSKEDANAKLKKKNMQGGFIRLIIAAAFLGIYSVMFFYPQLQDYLVYEERIQAQEEKIQEKETILESLEKERDFHKAAYDEEFKEEQRLVDAVLPPTTDKLGMIRLMENFATHLATSYPPFDFSSIAFQSVQEGDGYKSLAFQLSLNTSRANFERFLGLVNLSGNIDPEVEDHIRLMEISDISLNYLGADKDGKDKGVNFSVTMRAYSR